MSITVVIGIQDPVVAAALEDLLGTEGSVDVRAVTSSAESLLGAVLDHEPDVVLLHENFGPAPVLTITKELVQRVPWVGVVLLARSATADVFTTALDAGARGVVGLPVSMAELSARLTAVAWWSRTVRLGAEAKRDYERGGTVLAVAGAKGGVGTTTLAVQLAFVAAGSPERRVCLVDLDLYGANLADYLGTVPARSVRDLVELADELSPAVIHPVLFPHESGVRVMFSPRDVTEVELITASVVRRTLAVLRTMFDVVVVDCGTRVYEATLPAVELADRVALVATPDILAVRAAHDLCETWELLDVRQTGTVELVLNRVSRKSAVQPRLIGQTSAMPVCRIGVPAAFSVLETLANEGAAGLKSARALARPLQDLARHFGLVSGPRGGFVPLWRWRRAAREGAPSPSRAGDEAVAASGRPDRGSLPADLAATSLLLFVGVMLMSQLLLVGVGAALLAVTTPQVATRHGEGVPVARIQEDIRAGGTGIMRSVEISDEVDTVEVTLRVPFLLPSPLVRSIELSSDAGVVSTS